MNKAKVTKRFAAYLIDMIIITIVSALLFSVVPMNNKAKTAYNNIEKYTKEYTELLTKEAENKEEKKEEKEETTENQEAIPAPEEEKTYTQKELTSLIKVNSYTYSRETIIFTVIEIAISILYFGLLQYKLGGKTLGKRLLKIKLVSYDTNKKLTINKLLLRYLLVDSYGIDFILLVLIIVLKMNAYISVQFYMNILRIILICAVVLTTIIKQDGRGIHDIVSGTYCVNEEE